jgi:hypothetical protein
LNAAEIPEGFQRAIHLERYGPGLGHFDHKLARLVLEHLDVDKVYRSIMEAWAGKERIDVRGHLVDALELFAIGDGDRSRDDDVG